MKSLKKRKNTSLAAPGTHSPPAMPHCLQNPKWPLGGPKMADRIWKGVYTWFLGAPINFRQTRFWSEPSFYEKRLRWRRRKKMGKKKKRLMIIVATTSLPAVDHPNADRWNAARSCQLKKSPIPACTELGPAQPKLVFISKYLPFVRIFFIVSL